MGTLFSLKTRLYFFCDVHPPPIASSLFVLSKTFPSLFYSVNFGAKTERIFFLALLKQS